MKKLIALFFALAAQASIAGAVVIDPDNYAEGTDLTNISRFVTLTANGVDSVYAKSLSPNAAEGNDSLDLGNKIFSHTPGPSESYIDDEWMMDYVSMEITFHAAVSSFSILIAELFYDAAPGDDPTWISIFDKNNNLIAQPDVIWTGNEVELGVVSQSIDYETHWSYLKFEWSGENIGKVIIGGNSEPVTLDRLTFELANVPEPSAYILMMFGVALLFVRRKMVLKNS
ncbi:MAG TPA: PEP-CTERM sorting domain-containing protein [Cellvibrio sp.]|nr:PEP-CTERM sorting domain-containing protein [Cellvibrio sp.]